MINFNALKDAFKRVSAIGQGESVVQIDGDSITLRRLLPTEEAEAMAEVTSAVEEGDSTINIDQYKRSILARAIVQINDLDLRDVRSIPTGETVDGVAVRIDKVKAMHQVLLGFSQPTSNFLLRHYNELQLRTEAEVAQKLNTGKLSNTAEIEILQSRLAQLQLAEELASAGDPLPAPEQTADPAPTPDPTPDPTPAKPTALRTPTTPTRMVPVSPTPQPTVAAQVQVADDLKSIPDSFGLATDESMALEEARLRRIRAGQESPDVLSTGRTPPHLAARQASVQVDAPPRGGVNPNFVKRS